MTYKEIKRLIESSKDTKSLTHKLLVELCDCRNELCLRCRCYERAHLGACNGCRWEN